MHLHKHFCNTIEQIAPLNYQESYDNSGWQCGDKNDITSGILITLDVTEEVVDEAIVKGCNLIISHHPVLFPHVKKITTDNWIGRLLIKAISHKISIYTAHTNLDNVIVGVNAKLAEKLSLQNIRILSPMKNTLNKLSVFVPLEYEEMVKRAMFEAGAGSVGNYSECSFNTTGTGTFKANEAAQPFIGEAGGAREEAREVKIETIVPSAQLSQVLMAMSQAHPYEEVVYDIIDLKQVDKTRGAGMYGVLESEMSREEFLQHIKGSLGIDSIKYTHGFSGKIKKVAICGGSGSFLMQQAMAAQCDAFITSDYKYHQFFDAEQKILIADIGHFETEQYTSEIFYDILKEKFSNFAIYISNINTNPIKYFS